MTHQPQLIRLPGVDPEKKGVQMLRARAFQGYCEDCGWTGPERANYLTARYDVAIHKAASRGGDPEGGL